MGGKQDLFSKQRLKEEVLGSLMEAEAWTRHCGFTTTMHNSSQPLQSFSKSVGL